jgi:hypothetical protein
MIVGKGCLAAPLLGIGNASGVVDARLEVTSIHTHHRVERIVVCWRIYTVKVCIETRDARAGCRMPHEVDATPTPVWKLTRAIQGRAKVVLERQHRSARLQTSNDRDSILWRASCEFHVLFAKRMHRRQNLVGANIQTLFQVELGRDQGTTFFLHTVHGHFRGVIAAQHHEGSKVITRRLTSAVATGARMRMRMSTPYWAPPSKK